MRIGIIGSSGRLGSALVSYLSTNNEIIKCSSWECDQDTIERSDFTILCVPSDHACSIIASTDHPEKCIDVTAVKNIMNPFARRFISIHPLFGPKSIGNSRSSNIIFVKDLSIPESEKTISRIFPGFNILQMTADEHDRLMLSQLVFPYIVSIIQQGFPQPLTHSARLLDQARDIINGESGQVVRDIIMKNPHVGEFVNMIGEIVKDPRW